MMAGPATRLRYSAFRTDSECAVRSGAADEQALVQRQLITKCEMQDESRQRLAAPANWRARCEFSSLR